jgi:hypothetical protein
MVTRATGGTVSLAMGIRRPYSEDRDAIESLSFVVAVVFRHFSAHRIHSP